MFNLIPWKKKNNNEKDRNLTPYKSHPLAQMREELDFLFDRFLARWAEPFGKELGPGLLDTSLERESLWALDLEDKDQEVVVKAEVPGFEPGELDVQIRGNLLTIKAEKTEEKKGKNGDGRHAERRYRAFHRSVNLPPGLDPHKTEARYKNGLLEIHLPRSEQDKGKRITVKA